MPCYGAAASRTLHKSLHNPHKFTVSPQSPSEVSRRQNTALADSLRLRHFPIIALSGNGLREGWAKTLHKSLHYCFQSRGGLDFHLPREAVWHEANAPLPLDQPFVCRTRKAVGANVARPKARADYLFPQVIVGVGIDGNVPLAAVTPWSSGNTRFHSLLKPVHLLIDLPLLLLNGLQTFVDALQKVVILPL